MLTTQQKCPHLPGFKEKPEHRYYILTIEGRAIYKMVLLLSINKHLLCTRQLSKHVTSMNTYNLSNKPYEISTVTIIPIL